MMPLSPRSFSFWPLTGLVLLLTGTLLLLGGCNVVGALATVIGGDPKADARFVLPQVPTLVMADDPQMLLGNPGLSQAMGATVDHLFRNVAKASMPPIVEPRELARLAARLDRDYARTPIDAIGRAVQADQVIHILIESVDMRAMAGVYRPIATAQVKVIDAVEGKRLFPPANRLDDERSDPQQGIRIQATIPPRATDTLSRSEDPAIRMALSQALAEQAAQVFYRHTIKPQTQSVY